MLKQYSLSLNLFWRPLVLLPHLPPEETPIRPPSLYATGSVCWVYGVRVTQFMSASDTIKLALISWYSA